ncbi:MAG TPA: phosphatase PAP2 family protein [Gemmatimonadales bacterium]|nr:phosphatase PAP2 family protein [Gemmatimonadales bacterium]
MQRLIARYPRLGTFVEARFARGTPFGLHLTLGLSISMIGLVVFASIAENVFYQTSLVQLDLWLFKQLPFKPSGYIIGQLVTWLGSWLMLTAFTFTVGIILMMRRQWLLLHGWLVAVIGGEMLNLLLKAAFQRPRPEYSEILSTESWSFPSGHAMLSLVVYGMFIYLVTVHVPDMRRRHLVTLAGSAAVLILAIGWSRIYLGVHHLSDVVAGYAAGALWLSVCCSAVEVSRRRSPQRPAVALHPR